jgi:nitroreductase
MTEIELSKVISSVIRGRRSVFAEQFIKKEIPQSAIELVLENANFAPTHKLTQPWRFVVIRGAAKARLGVETARIYQEKTPTEKFLQKKYDSFPIKMDKADTIIAICIHFHEDKVSAWEEIAAVACAVQNMALTAHALNIGSYWGTPEPIAHLDEFLELAPNEKCYGLFFMGYHDELDQPAIRSSIDDKVRWLDK